jgi:hypothetical protein
VVDWRTKAVDWRKKEVEWRTRAVEWRTMGSLVEVPHNKYLAGHGLAQARLVGRERPQDWPAEWVGETGKVLGCYTPEELGGRLVVHSGRWAYCRQTESHKQVVEQELALESVLQDPTNLQLLR